MSGNRTDATIASADIARIAHVGRAAVSNWRRRYSDFPQPVAGTSSSPLFSLEQVELWLLRQGKLSEQMPERERVWHQVRAHTDDLRLLDTVSTMAACVAGIQGSTDSQLLSVVAGLAVAEGPAPTVEFLHARYTEAQSRRIAVIPRDIVQLMAALVAPLAQSVLDPSCGLGELLLAAQRDNRRLIGQERNSSAAKFAAARLIARGYNASIVPGDALRNDAFADIEVDAVLCSPPFGERTWGYEDLTDDARWIYGLPPKGESELAWVQHCLCRTKPGGEVIILMPSSAASRRSGRRIRSQMLRSGALRGVIALSSDPASQSLYSPQLWLLRRPRAEQDTVTKILFVDVSRDSTGNTAVKLWRALMAGTEGTSAPSATCRMVPIEDILDDEVDITPARYISKPRRGRIEVLEMERELHSLVRGMPTLVPTLRESNERSLTMITVGELIKSGALRLTASPVSIETGSGRARMLTVQDVTLGRAATGGCATGSGLVSTQAGDIVVPVLTRFLSATVINEAVSLGPHLYRIRADPELIDPHCLAGFLRASATGGTRQGNSNGQRGDIRRVRVPRIPIEDQQRLGEAFQRLSTFEGALRSISAAGHELAQAILNGLSHGDLRPD